MLLRHPSQGPKNRCETPRERKGGRAKSLHPRPHRQGNFKEFRNQRDIHWLDWLKEKGMEETLRDLRVYWILRKEEAEARPRLRTIKPPFRHSNELRNKATMDMND